MDWGTSNKRKATYHTALLIYAGHVNTRDELNTGRFVWVIFVAINVHIVNAALMWCLFKSILFQKF